MIRRRYMEMMNENGYFKAVEDEYIKSLPAGSFSGTIVVVDHPGILDEVEGCSYQHFCTWF